MGILGIPFNPANTIVIPLIFGIGIDDGVHVVHDFRAQRGRYHLTPSLTNAIFLTTLSTIIGFGSLMIADHRGLQSLGRVLVIGLASCTLVSLTLLPALLRWLTIHEEEETSSRFTGSRRLENELWGNDPIYHSPNRFSTPDFDGYPVRNRHPSRRD